MESRRPVKPENEARIIWQNDSLKNKTEYAVVYLHGFSASQEEGDPVHTRTSPKNSAVTFTWQGLPSMDWILQKH